MNTGNPEELKAMLQGLYAAVEGNPKGSVALDGLGESMGLDRRAAARVFQRLKQHGLAEVRGPGGQIGISVSGVGRVEALEVQRRGAPTSNTSFRRLKTA